MTPSTTPGGSSQTDRCGGEADGLAPARGHGLRRRRHAPPPSRRPGPAGASGRRGSRSSSRSASTRGAVRTGLLRRQGRPPMAGAQDFKRRTTAPRPNTGAWGRTRPCRPAAGCWPGRSPDLVLEPIAAALAAEGEPYVGVIYAGIMLTGTGRRSWSSLPLGDPEIQALLPSWRRDLMEPIPRLHGLDLSEVRLDWRPRRAWRWSQAAAGYPGPRDRRPSPASRARGRDRSPGLPGGTRPGPDGSVVPQAAGCSQWPPS